MTLCAVNSIPFTNNLPRNASLSFEKRTSSPRRTMQAHHRSREPDPHPLSYVNLISVICGVYSLAGRSVWPCPGLAVRLVEVGCGSGRFPGVTRATAVSDAPVCMADLPFVPAVPLYHLRARGSFRLTERRLPNHHSRHDSRPAVAQRTNRVPPAPRFPRRAAPSRAWQPRDRRWFSSRPTAAVQWTRSQGARSRLESRQRQELRRQSSVRSARVTATPRCRSWCPSPVTQACVSLHAC